jgi:hypothetical protein
VCYRAVKPVRFDDVSVLEEELVAPVDLGAEFRRRIEEASEREDPHERMLALKRVRAQLVGLVEVAEDAIEEAEDERDEQLRREALSYVRDNADYREHLLARGMATPERLDHIGLVSHAYLDEAALDGRLEEAAAGALAKLNNVGLGGGMLGKWLERLHPRDRGGKFAEKPGGPALRKLVGRDAKAAESPVRGREPGGRGSVKGAVKAPSAKKAERVFKTQDVKPEELTTQQNEGLVPGQRPAGMSARQARQERARTPEAGKRLRGQPQTEEETKAATEKDRAKRQEGLDKRVDKTVKQASESPTHFNEADKISQRALLDYVGNALSTPSTADAHSEMRDGVRVYHADRKQLHDAIIDVLLRQRNEDGSLSASNEYAPSQDTPSVLFMGGGYAAGKSSARKILAGRGEVPNDAVVIDPDQVKAMLPEFAHTAAHDPEANLRVYQEAWDVAQELQRRAQEKKMNVVVDGITNTSTDEVFDRVQGFKNAGYDSTRIAYVDVPTDVALQRAGDRAKKAAERGDGPNMRHIPEPIMRAVHRDVATTIPHVMSDQRIHDLGVHVEVYDGQEGALPIASMSPGEAGPTIHHDPGWTRLREKAGEQIAGVDAPQSATDPYSESRPGDLGADEGVANDHAQHFNTDKATATVPLNKLRSNDAPEQQSGVVDQAEQKLDAAAAGKQKLDPVQVEAQPDGSYKVTSGHDIHGAAIRKNWKDLPVHVTNAEDMPQSSGPEADPRDEAVAQRIGDMLDEREKAMTKNAPDMPWQTEEEVYHHAPSTHEAFTQVLDRGEGVSADLGADVHSSSSPEEFQAVLKQIEADPSKPHIIIGGLKGADRARDKVNKKYGGNWGKLHDVVRGTVVVPSLDNLPSAMEAVRRDAEQRGWKVSAVENRMVHVPGVDNSPGPTSSGYSDFNIKLESPEGFQTELQFNSVPMMLAKEGEGHKLYEQERVIVENAQSRGLPLSAQERTRLDELRRQQVDLYRSAWQESLGGSSTPGE